MDLDWMLTLGALAAATAVLIYGRWRTSLPPNPNKPRLLPWRPILIVAAFAALMAAVHLVNLAGFATGGGLT